MHFLAELHPDTAYTLEKKAKGSQVQLRFALWTALLRWRIASNQQGNMVLALCLRVKD